MSCEVNRNQGISVAAEGAKVRKPQPVRIVKVQIESTEVQQSVTGLVIDSCVVYRLFTAILIVFRRVRSRG